MYRHKHAHTRQQLTDLNTYAQGNCQAEQTTASNR